MSSSISHMRLCVCIGVPWIVCGRRAAVLLSVRCFVLRESKREREREGGGQTDTGREGEREHTHTHVKTGSCQQQHRGGSQIIATGLKHTTVCNVIGEFNVLMRATRSTSTLHTYTHTTHNRNNKSKNVWNKNVIRKGTRPKQNTETTN